MDGFKGSFLNHEKYSSKKNVSLSDGFSDWQPARTSRCLAIRCVRRPAQWGSAWASSTFHKIESFHRKQEIFSFFFFYHVCNIFPYFVCQDVQLTLLDVVQTTGARTTFKSNGLTFCLTWLGWLQDICHQGCIIILFNYDRQGWSRKEVPAVKQRVSCSPVQNHFENLGPQHCPWLHYFLNKINFSSMVLRAALWNEKQTTFPSKNILWVQIEICLKPFNILT